MSRRDDYRRAVFRSELPSTAKLVAVALSEFMDNRTLGDARPGPALLAKRTGLTARSVEKWLAALVVAGWLVQTSKGGSVGGRKASVYRGTIPRTSEPRSPVKRSGDSSTSEPDSPELVNDVRTTSRQPRAAVPAAAAVPASSSGSTIADIQLMLTYWRGNDKRRFDVALEAISAAIGGRKVSSWIAYECQSSESFWSLRSAAELVAIERAVDQVVDLDLDEVEG